MNENEYLAKAICEQLTAGSPVVIVSIMSLEGSTPRHEGTKMGVGADGRIYGTIGGSLIEATAVQEAKKIFSDKRSKILSFELIGKDANAPGMICGGKADILLDYVSSSEENRRFARQWCDTVNQGKKFYILTHLKGKNETVQVLGHAILQTEKDILVNTSLTADDVEKLKKELYTISSRTVLPLDDTYVLVDRIRKVKTVYCFGAGHVAVPTAHMAALSGFRVIVLDNRIEYANQERFPDADKTIVIDDFNHALEGLEIDEDSYIVIFTYGHQHDREVLEQVVSTGAGYIGLISSKRKRDAIFEALMLKGVGKESLEWVHSPIGLDIGAETPEEIAVSIVAELIKVRSGQTE